MKPIIKEAIQLIDPIFSDVGFLRCSKKGLWMIDKDYYAIIIELQPNSYSESVFMNTAVCFLWEKSEKTNQVLTFDLSYRINTEGEDILYDDCFEERIKKYANNAIKYVFENYNFQNISETRKRYYTRKLSLTRIDFWMYYNYSMLCFLDADFLEGKKFFNSFITELKRSIKRDSVYIEWKDKLLRHSIEEMLPFLSDKDNAIAHVKRSIRIRRSILSQKKEYNMLGN